MKIRNYILGLFASVAVLAGCEQEQELGPASLRTLETAITLPLEGGEQTITLKATRPWTATVSPSDASITVTPSSGQGSNDPVIVTVTAGKNASRNLNGKITFTSGSMKPVVVTVTQPGELGALYYADEIYSLANDTEVIVEGLVVGVNTKGCVIKDETGLVLAYNGSSTAAPSSVGKKVKVEGKVGIYGDLKQVAYTKLTEDPAAAVEVNHGEPVVADAAYLNAPKLDRVYYMTLEGRYQTSESKGKTYHNVIIEGASKQGSLQYHVQDLTSAVDHNVKFHGYFTGVNSGNYYTFLVTSFEDLGELVIDMSTIAQVLEKSVGTSVKTQGTVVAVNQMGLVLKDATGAVNVFMNSQPSVAVGDNVEVSGSMGEYNGLAQISSPTINPCGTTSAVDHGIAKSIKTLAELTDYMNKGMITEYVEIEGTVDGNLTYPEGATKEDFSVVASYYDGDITVYQGMKITMCGYSASKTNDGKKLNVIVTEIKADPFISAKDVAVLATATSAKIEVASNVDWTVATDASWVTYTKSTDGIDVTFEANTSETDDRVATFTLSAEGVTPVTVTLTQNKKGIVVAGEVTDVLNRAFAGTNSSSYTVWQKSGSASAAVYSGRTAGEASSEDIRITTSSNSGIVSIASGGKLKKVFVKWNETKAGSTQKTLNIYGSTTAYSGYADAYDSSKRGTLIGSCSYVKGAEVSEYTFEIPADASYTHVAFASADSVCYFDKIEITWEN